MGSKSGGFVVIAPMRNSLVGVMIHDCTLFVRDSIDSIRDFLVVVPQCIPITCEDLKNYLSALLG